MSAAIETVDYIRHNDNGVLIEDWTCREVADQPELEDEAKRIVHDLKLEGQQQLIAACGNRVPFKMLTREQNFVFKELCPETSKLDKYNRCAIPTRVLAIAEVASKLGGDTPFFNELVVLDTDAAYDPDPILLGVHYLEGYSWQRQEFLLARWGAELDELPALMNRAADQMRARLMTTWLDVQAKATAALARLKDPSALPMAEMIAHPAQGPELRVYSTTPGISD